MHNKKEDITLLPLNSGDSDLLARIYNSEDFILFGSLNYGFPYSDKRVNDDLDRFIGSRKDKFYTIDFKGAKVGLAEIFYIDHINSKCKLGILLLPEYTSKGIGTIVLDLLINITFKYLNIRKIETEILSTNDKSIKLVEKYGFEREGILKESVYINGRYEDIYLYGLIKK